MNDDDVTEGSPVQRSALAIDARHETAISAVAAKQQSSIQSRITQALARPRDYDTVRVAILKDCSRPVFAEKAKYRIPRGKKKDEVTGEWVDNIIEGASIRFAESAIRAFGNADVSQTTIYDDDEKRIIDCVVLDLEKNISWSRQTTVEKTIERRTLKKGQVPIASRLNSYGDTVYILPAGDDDLAMKEGAQCSKALRTCIMRVLPTDIVEEAMRKVDSVMEKGIKTDPDAARKNLVDSFVTLGVKPIDLIEYMGGQQIDALTPAQLVSLQYLWVGLKDGVVTWPEALKASPHVTQDDSEDKAAAAKAAQTRAKLEDTKKKIDAAKAKKAEAAAVKDEPAKTEQKKDEPAKTAARPNVDEPPEDWKPTDEKRMREPGE